MIKVDGKRIESHSFPNGETYIDMPEFFGEMLEIRNVNAIRVDFYFESNQDIWDLMQIVDWLKQKVKKIDLFMPYVPFSRMDRKENNRLFSLKTFANLINNMCLDSVIICEPHSDVTPALFNNVIVLDTTKSLVDRALVRYGVRSIETDLKKKRICLVYPDSGAEKRYHKQFKTNETMTISKERDFDTGWLKIKYLMGAEVHQDCEIAIIVDDLCSKGITFLLAAQELRKKLPKLKEVCLCITHCENTIFEGELLKTKDVNHIFTTDSLLNKERVEEEKETNPLFLKNKKTLNVSSIELEV